MQLTGTRRAEITMALVAIAMAAAFLFDARHLRPGVLEPVGPGTIPNATCWIVIGLAIAMLVRTLWGHASAGTASAGERWGDLAMVVGAVTAYVAALGFGWVRYGIATALFVAITVVWLAERRREAIPGAIVVALVLGFGLDYVFRHVLVTDLP
ncbi:MAG: tripartite tricarboxylate transporter TctB family protein [Casimicrobiaceae bacterium]